MTYNNKNMSGCSARGIALRDTKEELERLKEELKDSIYNIKIEIDTTGSNMKRPSVNR